MWPRVLLGGLTKLLPNLKDIIEVVAGNRKDRERNDYDEQIEIHREQAAGYTYKANNRNWFDRLVDGINRLPRPIVTFMVIGLFAWACLDPKRFTVSMRALDAVPEALWTIVSIILGFWFGSRLLAKDLSSSGSDSDRDQAREYFDRRDSGGYVHRPRGLAESENVGPTDTGNSVIDSWRNQR